MSGFTGFTSGTAGNPHGMRDPSEIAASSTGRRGTQRSLATASNASSDMSRSGFSMSAPKQAFVYPDSLSEDEDQDMAEVEEAFAQSSFIEVDQSLYTNALLSTMSSTDTASTKTSSFMLLIGVAVLQYVLANAILQHVSVAMSWTSASVNAEAMRELYEDLRHEGRLNYLRLERNDVIDLCGDFNYDLEETNLQGTNWSAYVTYKKMPVSSWDPKDIPPTDRSQLDIARFVLENDFYTSVYIIVTFVWILSVINEFRTISQFMLAVVQMPVVGNLDDIFSRDGDDLEILAITHRAKWVCILITLYRISMTSFIAGVGCYFLMWTSTNIELILNALALTFILELDHITYNATIASSRQNLIASLKRLSWSDPTSCASRYPNTAALTMGFSVLGSSCITTYMIRWIQRAAYMDMFSLAAAICLFQGPTPGYWTQFHATFPAPGLCETILQLKCESPIVGESGKPCVEDWNQKLCKFYVETKSMFGTWNSIDWTNQGACLAEFQGNLYPVDLLDFGRASSTFTIMASACQIMWQSRPSVIFEGRNREFTGPRVRVYPYMNYNPAGPFWCDYKTGSSAVLLEGSPSSFKMWKHGLKNCKNSVLVYSQNTAGGTWIESEKDQLEQQSFDGLSNLTSQSKVGAFSGIWLSKRLGITVISHDGSEASVSNTNLPNSPVQAKVDGERITILLVPPQLGTLKEDGKIYLDNGDVLISQRAAVAEEQAKDTNKRFKMWFR